MIKCKSLVNLFSTFNRIGLLLPILVMTLSLMGQSEHRPRGVYKNLQAKKSSKRAIIPSFNLFDTSYHKPLARSAQYVSRMQELTLKSVVVQDLLNHRAELVELAIPFEGEPLVLQLYEHKMPFDVSCSAGNAHARPPAKHFRGTIKDDPNSIAAISVFQDEVNGIISAKGLDNIVIGRWPGHNHLIYREGDLLVEQEFSCEAILAPGTTPNFPRQHQRSASTACVRVYFEATYEMYQAFSGDLNQVINYISALFNEVAVIYANEEINIELDRIHVWNTDDPYRTTTSEQALNSFVRSHRPNGADLNHLLDISGNNNGGRAYIDQLCGNNFNAGYSDISASFSNFPTYSWTVHVVAHELGHNFGSFHTQDCIWGQDNCTAIDGCAISGNGCSNCEKGPIPDKGTIMSYCHTSGGNGVDLSLGFGPEPGALIRARTAAASCLIECGGPSSCNLAISNVLVTDASCGLENGSLEVEVSGSSGTVTYDIGNGAQTSPVFENISPGNYTLIVSNGTNCERQTEVVVNQTGGTTSLSAVVTNATCGREDGIIDVEASGGLPPYSYRIGSKTQSSSRFMGLGEGDYEVVVTSDDGCSNTLNLSVFSESAISLSFEVTHTSCGENNGIVTLQADEGVAPYTYSLDNVTQDEGSFTGVKPGNYEARIVDKNGCEDTRGITIKNSEALTTEVNVRHTSCAQDNGVIEVVASGGTGNIAYSLNNTTGNRPLFDELPAGKYSVRVKDEAGCIVKAEAEINTSNIFDVQLDLVPTTCGLNNGALTVLVNDGEPFEEHKIIINQGNPTSESQFSDLKAGQYSVLVEDLEGCTVEVEGRIEKSTFPTHTVQVDHTKCSLDNGRVSVLIEGGIGPYGMHLGGNFYDTTIVEGLAPGQYSLTIEDAMGCEDSSVIVIDTSEAVSADLILEHTTCGRSNGHIMVQTKTGTAPFSYQVNDKPSYEPLLDSLSSGMHQVIIQDADGCTWQSGVDVRSSEGISYTLDTMSTTCGRDNGVITILATGGTGALLYSLDSSEFVSGNVFDQLRSGSHVIAIKDQLNCVESENVAIGPSSNPTISASKDNTTCGLDNGEIRTRITGGVEPFTLMVNEVISQELLSDLSAGLYQINVTDAWGCSDSTVVKIEPSTSPLLAVSSAPASCRQSNGEIQLTATRGADPYRFGIGNKLQSEGYFNELDSGSYVAVVVDAFGCVDSAQAIVEYDEQYVAPVLPEAGSLCAGTPIVLDTKLRDIDIVWSKDGDLIDDVETELFVEEPGFYTATVNYHENCQLSAQTIVSVRPLPPLAQLPNADTVCAGSVFVIPDPNPAMQYRWSNGQEGREVIFSSTEVYTLTVANEFDCTVDQDILISVLTPPMLRVAMEEIMICNGEEVTLEVDGADDYLWHSMDPAFVGASSNTITVRPDSSTYYYVVGSNECGIDSLQIYVGYFPRQEEVFSDTTVIEGAPIKLFVDGAQSATWSGDFDTHCSDCLELTVRPTEKGNVSVSFVNEYGCYQEATIAIDVILLSEIMPPLINAISPNGDGKNDLLVFEHLEHFEQVSLEIFDASGRVLYRDREYDNTWGGTFDGELLREGIYFYQLTLSLDDRTFRFDSDLTLLID